MEAGDPGTPGLDVPAPVEEGGQQGLGVATLQLLPLEGRPVLVQVMEI